MPFCILLGQQTTTRMMVMKWLMMMMMTRMMNSILGFFLSFDLISIFNLFDVFQGPTLHCLPRTAECSVLMMSVLWRWTFILYLNSATAQHWKNGSLELLFSYSQLTILSWVCQVELYVYTYDNSSGHGRRPTDGRRLHSSSFVYNLHGYGTDWAE